ncbi:uncharacterized protein LOC131939426 isoform X2 [Physella acuta]|uniref:uncharacterized protein LOC131939426 isoform X2 n=1 Tax=Physella acuta TaxID=109671 RepID=UPI0027DC170C|nr:uncharacterized protein LOC131939426 isoform X2 [Physella acuta]
MDNGQSLNKLLEFDNFVLGFQEPGLGQDACVEAYDKDDAVKHYAVSTVALAYRGPQYCADMAAAMVQDRREGALVLDVAAGTGLVGEELHKHGFKNIHALDGASQMLETCKQKGVYSDFIQCILLEGKQMPIANGKVLHKLLQGYYTRHRVRERMASRGCTPGINGKMEAVRSVELPEVSRVFRWIRRYLSS